MDFIGFSIYTVMSFVNTNYFASLLPFRVTFASSFFFLFYLIPLTISFTISSVQLSHSVMSNSLRPHGLQHSRPPCPSTTPRVNSNFCPLSQWCHQTFPSSVIPFPYCLQSFPKSGSFPIGHFFASGGPSIGVSASALVFPMNIQD